MSTRSPLRGRGPAGLQPLGLLADEGSAQPYIISQRPIWSSTLIDASNWAALYGRTTAANRNAAVDRANGPLIWRCALCRVEHEAFHLLNRNARGQTAAAHSDGLPNFAGADPADDLPWSHPVLSGLALNEKRTSPCLPAPLRVWFPLEAEIAQLEEAMADLRRLHRPARWLSSSCWRARKPARLPGQDARRRVAGAAEAARQRLYPPREEDIDLAITDERTASCTAWWAGADRPRSSRTHPTASTAWSPTIGWAFLSSSD